MKPRRLISPLQRAWLDELGVDTHWLSVKAVAGSPELAVGVGPVAQATPMPVAESLSSAAEPRTSGVPVRVAEVVAGDPESLALVVQARLQGLGDGVRGRAVPGYGVRVRPRYFIVGEQPGIEDEAVGRPFQGDPGRLLQAMLAAAHLPQADQVYFTTLVKCRVAGGRAPSREEIAVCLPYLQQEIALVQPQWVLALGAVAAQALLRTTEDLDALRGRRHAWAQSGQGDIPVWVTYHPSSLLVRSSDKLQAWRDLVGLAQAIATAPR